MTFLDRLNSPKFDFTQNWSGSKIISSKSSLNFIFWKFLEHSVPVIVLWEWPVDRGYLDIVVQHKLWIPGTIGDWEHLEFDVFALLAFVSLRQRFWRPQQPLQPLWETFVFKERKLKIISKNTIVCIQYMHPKFA